MLCFLSGWSLMLAAAASLKDRWPMFNRLNTLGFELCKSQLLLINKTFVPKQFFSLTSLHTCPLVPQDALKLKPDVLLPSVSSPHYRMTPTSLVITHFATLIRGEAKVAQFEYKLSKYFWCHYPAISVVLFISSWHHLCIQKKHCSSTPVCKAWN